MPERNTYSEWVAVLGAILNAFVDEPDSKEIVIGEPQRNRLHPVKQIRLTLGELRQMSHGDSPV